MRCGNAIVDLRAGEVEELARTTTLFLRLVRPIANTGLLGKDETLRTSDHVKLALHAVVEGVAISGVLVGEVAVHARAVWRWLWLLKFRSLRAIDTERQIALLVLRAEVIEDETVGAEFLRYFVVSTVVIFIALFRIRKITIGLRTLIQELFIVLVFLLYG